MSFIRNIKKHPVLYIMVLPGVVYLLIFNYAPMYGVVIAFKDFSVTKGIWESPWVGLENFKYLFGSKEFLNIFRNSILMNIYRLVFAFSAPIPLALLLNEIRLNSFKRVTQTIVYLPHFISWVVIAGIVQNLLSFTAEGQINYLLKLVGFTPVNFLMEPRFFRSIIVLSEIWKEAGWGTIVYLAAITSIDMALYESAVVDGAGRLKQIWYITLPGIIPTIIVMLILRMGSLLNNGFEQIFLLYNALTMEVADVFETYTFRVGLREGRFSFATAVGIFQSLVGMIMIYSTNKLSRKVGETGLW